MTVINTQRLVLRPWEDADAEALFALASDPAVGNAAGWPAHASVEESRDVIRDVLRGKESFAVCLRGTGEAGEVAGTLVGAVALTDAAASTHAAGPDERELGYWTGRPFWGRGYMPEAARALIGHARRAWGVRTVWLGFYVGNRASARVATRLGFRYVRCDRGIDVPLLGEVRDEAVMRLDLAAAPAEEELARRVRELLAGDPEPARFLSITEPVKLGRVTVLAVGDDLGALVRFKRNGAYFAAPVDGCAARIMASMVPDGALVSLCDERYLEIFAPGAAYEGLDPGRYELWAYGADASPLATGAIAPPEGFTIAPLGPGDIDTVEAHYALLSHGEIEDHLERGWIYGGFDASGALVGFIGEHDEASMGMLEIFPEARRRGYAQALEAALIDTFMAAGRIPYCHVALDNEASKALQRKLGLRRIDTVQCWFGMPPRR